MRIKLLPLSLLLLLLSSVPMGICNSANGHYWHTHTVFVKSVSVFIWAGWWCVLCVVVDEVFRQGFSRDAAQLFITGAQRPQLLQLKLISAVLQHQVNHHWAWGTHTQSISHKHYSQSVSHTHTRETQTLHTEVDALPVITVASLQTNMSLLILTQSLELQTERVKSNQSFTHSITPQSGLHTTS